MEILVPVSVGELVDKITILRIKSRMIKDQAKLENIQKELSALEGVCKKSAIGLGHSLVSDLEAVK